METQTTTPSLTYFRPTTVSQRNLLFRTVAETDNVPFASLKGKSYSAGMAHVGRSTYYYWLPRFSTGGYRALAQEKSRAPHSFRIEPIAPDIIQEVKETKRANPEAGYRSIANEVRKAHDWHRVIGPTKVREVLIEAGLVTPHPQPTPKAETQHSCHAPEPLKTLNVDLCLVPMTHEAFQPLASVSVASAAKREIPTDPQPSESSKEWPGQVFEEEGVSYDRKMTTYVQRRASKGLRKHRRRQKQAQRAVLMAKEQELRCQRRRKRWARRQADHAWGEYRQSRKTHNRTWKALSRTEKRNKKAQRLSQDQKWCTRRDARRVEVKARVQEDAAWRQERQAIRQKQAELDQKTPPVSVWLAILVILDNCTRVSLKLPVFKAGAHVTAEMVVEALTPLLPPELKYLISDNGPQFTAQVFEGLAAQAQFIHVRIAPHRACTNGIAERFVQTLKGWLEKHTWHNDEELIKLMEKFHEFYNDRPHQGAELSGLSPNEYTRRLLNPCLKC